ncbi:MAG: diguanylate cyclase [Verrucomicrobiota bacterium]
MALVQILSGLAQFLLVVAVCFMLLCILASHLRFQHMAHRAAIGAEELDPGDVFQTTVAQMLGTVHRQPEPFCVALVAPDNLPGIVRQYGAAGAQDLLKCLEDRVRKTVRENDAVLPCGSNRIGVVLHAARSRGELVAERLAARIEEEPCRCSSGLVIRTTASVGVSSHPENGDRARALIEQAEEGFLAAAGGHQRWAAAPAARAEAFPPPPTTSAPGAEKGPGSLVDPLTGVLRPERLGVALHKFLARYRRDDRPVSVLLVDIDHLSRYNEHYGREAGDQVLKGLGELLQQGVREDDLLARYGGEEFLVGMGCSPANALAAAQRLVSLVKKTAFPAGGSSLRITVSIGIAGCPDHGSHPRHLLEAAEAAAGDAKRRGRNMCLLYEPTMHLPRPPMQPTDVF